MLKRDAAAGRLSQDFVSRRLSDKFTVAVTNKTKLAGPRGAGTAQIGRS